MYPTHLRKVGGSLMLAIPPLILEELHFSLGQRIELLVEDEQLIIRAAKKKRKPTLEELLAECDSTAEMPLRDSQWLDSKPIGRELL
jgi:antitoxin ChpS